MTSMKAAVTAGPQHFEIHNVDRPDAPPGRVLVRIRNCGICGSDLHVYRGDFPTVPHARLGHEPAGEIAAVGDGVTNVAVGDRVAIEPIESCRECGFCRTGRNHLCLARQFIGIMLPGAYAEYLQMPAYGVHRLPDNVDFEVGALVEPLAVSVHGLRQVGVSIGERVVVLGAGTIGLTALVAARAMGASDVFVTARYPHQIETAKALGAAHVVQAGEGDVVALTEAFAGRPPDVVVETVGGTADTLNQAVALAQLGGRISILGIFTGPVSLNVTPAVLKELKLIGGITYGRPGPVSDFEVALQIASRHADELRRLITHRVSLDDIERGFAIAADKSQRSIKVTVELG